MVEDTGMKSDVLRFVQEQQVSAFEYRAIANAERDTWNFSKVISRKGKANLVHGRDEVIHVTGKMVGEKYWKCVIRDTDFKEVPLLIEEEWLLKQKRLYQKICQDAQFKVGYSFGHGKVRDGYQARRVEVVTWNGFAGFSLLYHN